MNRILVTGAAGFLGRWFARHHLAQNDVVIGVDDLSNEHSHWPDELPEKWRVHLDAGKYFERTRYAFDIAYHFAAPVGGRTKIEDDPLFNADSLRLDSMFFRWALGRVGIAVYPSSSAVYGTQLQEGSGMKLHEGMFHPGTLTWLAPDQMYGFSKLVGEMLAWKAEGYGLNTLCIRPFSGYGEGQSKEYPVPSILARAKAHEDPLVVWGTGQQKRDFVHVEDLVGATIARLNAGVRGYKSMNIASGQATSFYEIAQVGAQLAGYKPNIGVDVSKPAGVSSRYGDPTVMNEYYQPSISLEQGLGRVLETV